MGFKTGFLGLVKERIVGLVGSVRERRVGSVWVHSEEEEQKLCL